MSERVAVKSPAGQTLTITRDQFDGVYRHLGYAEDKPESKPRKSTVKHSPTTDSE